VSEEEKLFTARPPPGADGADVYSASTVAKGAPEELLDLVRSAEESARVAIGGRETPTSATKFHAASRPDEDSSQPRTPAAAAIPPPPDVEATRPSGDVMDVSTIADDDVSVPPQLESTPPLKSAMRRAPAPHAAPASERVDTPARAADHRGGLPPAVAAAIVLALMILALAVIVR
jgi:hypothetical protein